MPHLFSALNLFVRIEIAVHSLLALDRSVTPSVFSWQSPKNRAMVMVVPFRSSSLTPAIAAPSTVFEEDVEDTPHPVSTKRAVVASAHALNPA